MEREAKDYSRYTALPHLSATHNNNNSGLQLGPIAESAQLSAVYSMRTTDPMYSATQGVQEHVRQVPMDSITPTLQVVHEQSEDSTNQEAIGQSEEPGPSAPKEKEALLKCKVCTEGRTSWVTSLAHWEGNGTFCPLNVFDWRKLDTKNDIWKYVKEKYDIPEEAKKWVFDSICTAWRKYKSQLKRKHFEAYENDELRMENRPLDVPASHFKALPEYWNSDPAKKMSETNIENRKKLKHLHTADKTPFALIIEEKNKEMADTSDTLLSKDIFVATRKRKPSRVYKGSYENTISKIAEMERIQSTQESGDVSDSVDTFALVLGPKHPGRVRLYGRGVNKTILKKKKEILDPL
ncbi:PREDICTED: uncharacterized protein LOC109218645 [Nicotiana attenuata]|uniref:uncharacterized protein LOC109218645 n=1 Tax=Nicotiana attenuata TaxID=49451 RepID=UPI0009059A46|nr:PREDICTED: uncharacterized protein LOC109218645 [Nicotiana attenuata]